MLSFTRYRVAIVRCAPQRSQFSTKAYNRRAFASQLQRQRTRAPAASPQFKKSFVPHAHHFVPKHHRPAPAAALSTSAQGEARPDLPASQVTQCLETETDVQQRDRVMQ